MSIEAEPARNNVRTYMRMAKAYVEELSQYDAAIRYDSGAVRKEADDTLLFAKDGRFVGFVDAKIERLPDGQDVLYIAEFYIDPAFRRRGVGTEIMDAILNIWKGDMYLHVLHENETAKRFWEYIEHRFDFWRVYDSRKLRYLEQDPSCEVRMLQRSLSKGESR